VLGSSVDAWHLTLIDYSSLTTENQRDAPGPEKILQVLNYVVAQAKSALLGSIGIHGLVIRWSRVRAPPAPLSFACSMACLGVFASPGWPFYRRFTGDWRAYKGVRFRFMLDV
jgi:hypothetical protein